MGWMELMLVGVVALIVVGPKDLPVMFQALGKMTAKLRRMAREFSTAMNDAANATGAADVAKDLKGLTSPKAMGMDKLKEAADKFDKWDPGLSGKPRTIGSETAKLTQERAEQARKIREKTAEVAQARLDREAAEAKTGDTKAGAGAAEATRPAAKPQTTAKAEMPAKAEPKAKPAAKAAKPAAKPAAKSTKPSAGSAPAKAKPVAKPTAKPAKAAKGKA